MVSGGRLGAALACAAMLAAGCGGSDRPLAPSPGTAARASGTAGRPVADARYTDPSAAAEVLAAAGHAMEISNTYDYRRLEEFRQRGDSVATGVFRIQFDDSVARVLRTRAPAVHQVQTASIAAVGLDSLSGARATTLVVVRVHSVNTSVPRGRNDVFAARVTLDRVGGRWAISRLLTLAADQAVPALGTLPGTAGLRDAADAAVSGVRAVSSLSYRGFDAAYAHALTHTTGTLHADLVTQRASTRSAVLTSKADVSVLRLARGVEQVAPDSVDVLIVFVSHTSAGGDTAQRVRATVTRVGQQWLLSALTSVGD